MTGIAEKLAGAGYSTHMAGKWDAGMATPDHTPLGRGYQSSLNYCMVVLQLRFLACVAYRPPCAVQHANDYWTSIDARCVNSTTNASIPIVDLWDTNTASDMLCIKVACQY